MITTTYDGVSSNDKIDSTRFPGYSASTIGDLFNEPSQLALSQVNGAVIWIRSSEWEPTIFGKSVYQRTNYGVGTLLHEILHKAMTGGGNPSSDHSQLAAALGIPPLQTSSLNNISNALGSRCF